MSSENPELKPGELLPLERELAVVHPDLENGTLAGCGSTGKIRLNLSKKDKMRRKPDCLLRISL